MDIGAALLKIRSFSAAHNKGADLQEAVFILSELIKKDFTYIILNKTEKIPPETASALDCMLEELFVVSRPLDKITKRAYFFGLELYTDEDVMTPRKETEILAETVIRHIKDSGIKKAGILDLCTGSGCIAIALAANCEVGSILASDISEKALAVAEMNIDRYQLHDKIRTVRSDLFDVVNGRKFDIIISNPPYISDGEYETLDVEVTGHDPAAALKGGHDGLDFYRRIFMRAHAYLSEKGSVFCEIGRGQAGAVSEIMKERYTDIKVYRDHSGNDRVISCRLRGDGEKK